MLKLGGDLECGFCVAAPFCLLERAWWASVGASPLGRLSGLFVGESSEDTLSQSFQT